MILDTGASWTVPASDLHRAGSTYIVAPTIDASIIWSQVPGSKTYNNGF